MFSFMKSFLGVKGKQLGQEIVAALVEIDPESATQAQLDQMEKDLDRAGMVLQKIRSDYEREVREAEAATKRYDQMMAAAEHLQARLEQAGAADRAPIEASLATLVGQLEAFAPEVDQEKRDVVEVQALLDEAQAAYKAKAESLSKAKQNLDRAKRDMQRAVIQKDRAEDKARRAAEVAGLHGGGTNRLTVAVDSMHRKAEEARASAEAAAMKAQTMTAIHTDTTGDDPLIAEAMRAAQTGTAGGANPADRLAALKAKR